MTILELIRNHIRTRKSGGFRMISIVSLEKNTLKVRFLLSIPGWIDDKEVIKDKEEGVLYSKYKNKRYVVTLDNINDKYPSTGSNKYYYIDKYYDILDIIKEEDIGYFFTLEKNRHTREIRANITLMKIGQLTEYWNNLTSNKCNGDKELLNYATQMYNTTVDQEFYRENKDEDLPF